MKEKINLYPEKIEYSWKDKKKEIILPKYLSEDLAYLIGVHIGDGTMNIYRRKNQVDYFYELCGHEINDKLFYEYVMLPLFKNLFNINAKIRQNSKGCIGINIRSKALVSYLNECLGVSLGKKEFVSIPEVILSSGLRNSLACIRGIFDTDFSLSFKKKKKLHSYPIISLNSLSDSLIFEISKILNKLEISGSIFTQLRNDRRFKCNRVQHLISISGKTNLEKWFKLIGSKNPSYISRYAVYKKFGFCPPYTNYLERRNILIGKIDPYNYY
jgi:hypothetical protein